MQEGSEKGGQKHGQKRHEFGKIFTKGRRSDVGLGEGKQVPDVQKPLLTTRGRTLAIKKIYGGTQPDEFKELNATPKEQGTSKRGFKKSGRKGKNKARVRRG